MKDKTFMIVILLIILAIGTFFAYHYIYIPMTTKLSIPENIPFYSVQYHYRLEPVSLINFKFGSESVSSFKLSSAIGNDLDNIKEAGFQGIKLEFYFRQNNYISNRIALKAAQKGLYPIGLLAGHNVKPKDRVFTEEELKEWESFVRQEVRKNKNRIYYWEVWNEPDIGLFWYGESKDYLILLKRTYKVIKEENPDAKVIVTLDAQDKNRSEFSYELLSLGGEDYFDILSFHPYAGHPFIREDIFNESIIKEREMLAKYNNKWPLWISEIGQPSSEVGEEEQGRLAEFVFTRTSEEKIPMIWFFYSDQRAYLLSDGTYGWGLYNQEGNPKPFFERIKSNFLKK